MLIKYQWRELNDCGLLVYPKTRGPEWDKDGVNDTGPFNDECEAISALEFFTKKHNDFFGADFVLVKIFAA